MLDYFITATLLGYVVGLVVLFGDRLHQTRKLVWAIIILLLPIVGVALYFVLGRIGHDYSPPNGLVAEVARRDTLLSLGLPTEIQTGSESVSPPAPLPGRLPADIPSSGYADIPGVRPTMRER